MDSSSPPTNAPLSAWALAWHIGYSIVVPLILFVVGGIFVDKNYETSPVFTLVGLGLAFLVTTLLLIRRVRRILRESAITMDGTDHHSNDDHRASNPTNTTPAP